MRKKSYLALANDAIRQGNYESAVKNYITALDDYETNPRVESDFVAQLIAVNVNLLKNKLGSNGLLESLTDRLSSSNSKNAPITEESKEPFGKEGAERAVKNYSDVVDAKWKLGDQIDFNIEGLKYFGGLYVIHGWIFDPNMKVESLRLSLGKSSGDYEFRDRITRYRRPDVEAAFKRTKTPDMNTCFGFVGVVQPKSRSAIPVKQSAAFTIGTSSGKSFSTDMSSSELPATDESLKTLFGIIPSANVTGEQCELYYGRLFEAMTSQNKTYQVLADKTFGKKYAQSPSVSPDLSVIVPLYGDTRFEETQLPIMASWRQKNWELIFAVDDPRIVSDVLTNIERLSSNYGIAVRVLAPNKNLGFSGINNLAAKSARGQTLLFLNSDCFVTDLNPLKKGLAWLKKKSSGMVGFRLFYPDGSIQHDGMSVSKLGDSRDFYLNDHPRIGLPLDLVGNIDEENDSASMLTAACLMVRRDVFDSVEGFDQAYWRGDFEDSDLCLKVINLGKKLGIVRGEGIYHLERQTIRSQENDFRQKITLINSNTYSRKWGDALTHSLPTLQVVK